MDKEVVGDGFLLRPLSMEDLDAYFEAMQDFLTIAAMNSVPLTLEETADEIQELISRKGSESFTLLVDKKCAGNVRVEYENFDVQSKTGRLHIWIHPAFRKQGLATKALQWACEYGFTSKGFTRIIVQCKADNKAVRCVNEKAGFVLDKIYVIDGVEKAVYVKTVVS